MDLHKVDVGGLAGDAFGQKIGRYQAVKHKCADMYIKLELARAHALHGLAMIGTNGAELRQVAAAARVASLDALAYCAEENVQLHGGIGFTWEHPAHLYFKRAKSSELLFGDPTYHRELLAQRIGI